VAIRPGQWRRAVLYFKGDQITVAINEEEAGKVADATYRQGMFGLGCGYEAVEFDNVAITGDPPVPGLVPARVSASSVWSDEYGPEMAIDGDPTTRWNTARGQHSGWLELDFGRPVRVGRAVIDEALQQRITRFTLDARQADGSWKPIATGTTIGPGKELRFSPLTAQRFRLNIIESPPETPTIAEIQLFEK
jgi:hypothetical protein